MGSTHDSAFTIYDGTVQHLLTKGLLSGIGVCSIVGEEECNINLSHLLFIVDDLDVPDEFMSITEKARYDMQELVKEIPQNAALYKALTAFINPFDGTREFANGKGE
eukprot:7125426-Ditylum_brightwellii.AAC.1